MSLQLMAELTDKGGLRFGSSGLIEKRSPVEARIGTRHIQEGPETIRDLGAGVPTGTFTVFPGCAALLIGFAEQLLDEEIAG
jgi:hypothetical protein